jgi:hypothetical protein
LPIPALKKILVPQGFALLIQIISSTFACNLPAGLASTKLRKGKVGR